MQQNQFTGALDGFRIWEGVVEDINDPQQVGRVRVRVIGLHTDDRNAIPTESLPWAMVVMPCNSASVSGVGASPTGILTGTTVALYFRDAPDNQQPVVLGTFNGFPTQRREKYQGFSDPNGEYPRDKRLNEPDSNRLARGKIEDTSIEEQNRSRTQKIQYPNSTFPPDKNLETWDEPESPYAAQYTYNKVFETASGHCIEVDDTPEKERIRIWHRTGTMFEVHENGTFVNRVTKDNIVVVYGNKQVNVQGNMITTIQRDNSTLVVGNDNTLISGSQNISIQGNLTGNVYGTADLYVGGDLIADVIGNATATVNGNLSADVVGDTTLKTKSLSVDATDSISMKTKEMSIDAETLEMKSKEITISAETKMEVNTPTLDLNAFTTLFGDFTGTILASGTLAGMAATALAANPAEISGSTPPPVIPIFTGEAPEEPAAPTEATPEFSNAMSYAEDNTPESIQAEVAKTRAGGGVTRVPIPEENQKEAQALGLPPSDAPVENPKPVEENMEETPKPANIPPPQGCTTFPNPLDPTNQLSKHITLADLQVNGDKVKEQNGLSIEVLVCNLQKLSQNVIDRVIDQFGRPVLTDGFRSVAVAQRIGSKATSMHCMGCACDMQFVGKDEKFHYDVAVWIKDNCEYAELILEYGGGKGPWIHVAYNDNQGSPYKWTNTRSHFGTRVSAPSDYKWGSLMLLKNVPNVGGR